DAIIARRGEDRTVANFGEAEAIVRVPHMRNAATEPLFPTLNDSSRVRPRAVIRHQHFKICIALLSERTQHRVQRVRPVVGSDDDREETDHWDATQSLRGTRVPAELSPEPFTPFALGFADMTKRRPEIVFAKELPAPERAHFKRRRVRHVPAVEPGTADPFVA